MGEGKEQLLWSYSVNMGAIERQFPAVNLYRVMQTYQTVEGRSLVKPESPANCRGPVEAEPGQDMTPPGVGPHGGWQIGGGRRKSSNRALYSIINKINGTSLESYSRLLFTVSINAAVSINHSVHWSPLHLCGCVHAEPRRSCGRPCVHS